MHCHPNAFLAPRGRARVFEAVEAGMTVSAACDGVGVSRRCYYRWLPRVAGRRRGRAFEPAPGRTSPERLAAHEATIVALRVCSSGA